MSKSVQNMNHHVAEWPDADQQAWAKACQATDLFDPAVGLASRWRPATRTMIEAAYTYFLRWARAGGRFDDRLAGAQQATKELVEAYYYSMAELADYTRSMRLTGLGDALQVMAPDHDWAWIKRAGWRVHANAVPARDLRPRLRQSDEVYELGLDMIDAATNDKYRTPIERATLFRDGLLLALLTLRPMRLRNLAALELDRNLLRRGEGWWISVPDTEVKSGPGMECAWPTSLAAHLDVYLAVHRPTLQACSKGLRSAGCKLWVSKQGTAMTNSALAYEIKKRTVEEFGEAINPQSFRHMAATMIATVDPENAAYIAAILGHATISTSEKHYNRARTVDAGRRYQTSIAETRRRTKRK